MTGRELLLLLQPHHEIRLLSGVGFDQPLIAERCQDTAQEPLDVTPTHQALPICQEIGAGNSNAIGFLETEMSEPSARRD